MTAVAVTTENGGIAFWARVTPFAIYLAFLALSPAIADSFPDQDGRWLYSLKVGAVVVALLLLRRNFRELAKPGLAWHEMAWAAVAGMAVFFVWIHLDGPWVSLASSEFADGYDPRSSTGDIDWRLALPRLAGAALVVPVMEELFWRSLVMRWIDHPNFLAVNPTAISLRALLTSSLIFGFEHQLWLAGILAGLVYGELYRRSGNLWLPIVAHAVTNGVLGIWVLTTRSWQFW